jgi:hypothetical protein
MFIITYVNEQLTDKFNLPLVWYSRGKNLEFMINDRYTNGMIILILAIQRSMVIWLVEMFQTFDSSEFSNIDVLYIPMLFRKWMENAFVSSIQISFKYWSEQSQQCQEKDK